MPEFIVGTVFQAELATLVFLPVKVEPTSRDRQKIRVVGHGWPRRCGGDETGDSENN